MLSKNWDNWNPKFQQNSIVYYFFFIFLAFLTFCFLFHLSKLVQKLWNFFSSICTCQKILEIFMFFYFYGLEILSKNFRKSWIVFQKNIDIWNPKFFINSIVYYLFFYSFIILVMFFFLYHVSKLVKKC